LIETATGSVLPEPGFFLNIHRRFSEYSQFTATILMGSCGLVRSLCDFPRQASLSGLACPMSRKRHYFSRSSNSRERLND
jgi:hypothetical protein